MIKTVCVCGGGTMGSGIAQLIAQAGFPTILYDVSNDLLDRSCDTIKRNVQAQIDKKKFTEEEGDTVLSNLTFSSSINACYADIIIEAIIENLDAKTELFNTLAQINFPETIFATNTSSLSITNIASKVNNPARVVGMHFFNPALVMKLVEVVKGEQTSENIIATVCELAKKVGKIPVVCRDSPGFIVNRIARPYYLEALNLIESGVIDFAAVDRVLETSGFRMGPFKLMDLIGIDINYTVSKEVWSALGKPNRLMPSSIQKAKVDANELGIKTAKGFYSYESTSP
jgi:3-hydroxybutyryl-CoA dehydrogenase